ncbi:hypothetical protein EC973_005845 [Apophysomyces ossiformis]|uniref:Uncharacterized protein n=1 Tax=Apophysomyces ossiformis TaxID=679940 RepID=A0A8H7BZ60_9FUNG|nr:hypothetical protein EC973_005845 [Apophysomyces ossiformis]
MSGLSYIGSKISLISKSDIRYVGILHDVDSQNATIALEQVVSFGTEGRRGRVTEEIPPSDSVFEYIIFRGSDVKDLQVFEAPPQPSTFNYPPVQGYTAYPPAPSSSQFTGYSFPNSHGYPPHQQQAHIPMGYPVYPSVGSHGQSSIPTHPPMSETAKLGNFTPQIPNEVPPEPKPTEPIRHELSEAHVPETKDAGLTRDIKPVPKPDLKDDAPSRTVEPKTKVIDIASSVEQLAKTVSELGVGGEKKRDRSKHNKGSNQPNIQRGGRGGKRTADRNGVTVPSQDFDFVSSNAKFNKEDALRDINKKNPTKESANTTEVDHVSIPEPDVFYDKNKSFFDDISCEAKERSDAEKQSGSYRRTHQEERKLNLETFGQSTVEHGRHFRSRGRGNRWGGGFRGRGRNERQIHGAA